MSDILLPGEGVGIPLFSITELLVSKLAVSENDLVIIWLPENTPNDQVVQMGAALTKVIGGRFAHIIARRGSIEIEGIIRGEVENGADTEE